MIVNGHGYRVCGSRMVRLRLCCGGVTFAGLGAADLSFARRFDGNLNATRKSVGYNDRSLPP